MRLPTLILLFILLLIAAFSVLNWGVFMAPTEVTLGFATVQLPLGLLMLGLLVLVCALFLLYVVYLQASALLDTRRHTRELRSNRELADQAEASRFTELRAFLETALAQRGAQQDEAQAALLARIAQLDHALRELVEQQANSLAASIGELEDRLEPPGRAAADRS